MPSHRATRGMFDPLLAPRHPLSLATLGTKAFRERREHRVAELVHRLFGQVWGDGVVVKGMLVSEFLWTVGV